MTDANEESEACTEEEREEARKAFEEMAQREKEISEYMLPVLRRYPH